MKRFTKIIAVCLLVIMVIMTFASCGIFSLNLEKVAKRLISKDYSVNILSSGNEFDLTVLILEIEAPEIMLSASKGDDDVHCFVAFKFKNIDDAKSSFDKIENFIIDSSYNDDYICKRQGKVIYGGTRQGVKDALCFPMNLYFSLKLDKLFDDGEKKERLTISGAERYLTENGYEVSFSSTGEWPFRATDDNDNFFYAMIAPSEEEAEQVYTYLKVKYESYVQDLAKEGIEAEVGIFEDIIYFGTKEAIDIAYGR